MDEVAREPFQKRAEEDKIRYSQELEAFRRSKMMMNGAK